MSVINRQDTNVINPPDQGESFFHDIGSGANKIIEVPAGKNVCYFVITASTSVFYTYSRDENDPPVPATAPTSDGVINSHLLPNALNVSNITKLRIAPQAETTIYFEFREEV